MNKSTDTGVRDEHQKDENISEDRRRFLKTASKAALTAPAVTLLLAASTKPRQAAAMYTYDPGGWIP